MPTPAVRSGSPGTHKRRCGTQPADQSMITDVHWPRLLPYAASLLPPSNAGDVARQDALTADIRASAISRGLTLCLEVPRQQLVEAADGMAVRQAVENGGDVGFRIQAVQLRGFRDGVDDRSPLPACIAADEQKVLPRDGSRTVILPISGLRSSSTTAGTRCMASACGATAAKGRRAATSSMSRRLLGSSLSYQGGCWIRSPARDWGSAPRGWPSPPWPTSIIC